MSELTVSQINIDSPTHRATVKFTGSSDRTVDPANGQIMAWCNFTAKYGFGIVESFNISSITENATGWYTFNFDTPLPDTSYVYACSAQQDITGTGIVTGRDGYVTIGILSLSLGFSAASTNTLIDIETGMLMVVR